ncbi:MAG TPA: lysine--tRNA ligase [Acidimicrobiales bacterium]|nr:lysine--tRNA ligase [Acidimicrobiales bacterium]
MSTDDGPPADLPYRFERSASAAQVTERFSALAAGEESGTSVSVAGRIMLSRPQGALAFAELRDSSGAVQLFALKKVTERFEEFARLNLGDWVGAHGEVVRTRRGELSVKVDRWSLLAPARRSFGDKWRGVTDVETRYRQREVDLWANERSRQILVLRSALVQRLRERLWERGFVEVETPILHPIPGGAHARPFVTRHNALDADFYLRIAPELYLKRLVVGGFEKVFEIGRLFRNEGISPRHNPEFTTVELYQAYADYGDLMLLVEELVSGLAVDLLGTTSLTYQGRPLELAAPWRRATMAELVSERLGRPVSVHTPAPELRRHLEDAGGGAEASAGPGRLLLELYEKTTEGDLWGPVFVTDYPAEVSPLSRRHRDDPDLVERFEAIVAGRELVNAFSELTDPDEQRARFEEQAALRSGGDEEAMVLDEEFLRALEHGLPPTAGLGLGVDRLAMVLADAANIREVIAFPTLRPEA